MNKMFNIIYMAYSLQGPIEIYSACQSRCEVSQSYYKNIYQLIMNDRWRSPKNCGPFCTKFKH